MDIGYVLRKLDLAFARAIDYGDTVLRHLIFYLDLLCIIARLSLVQFLFIPSGLW